MAKQKDIDTVHMSAAKRYATLSKAVRAKVGALIVTKDGIMVPGFNGTPPGFDNECEHVNEQGDFVTKPIVVHAEMNAILKAASAGLSLKNATVYCTHSPCLQCAAKMVHFDFRRFIYGQVYKNTDGIDLLEEAGVTTELFKRGHTRNE